MREYPHGLDKETLPKDLEVEQKTISNLEEDVEQAIARENAVFLRIFGNAYYAVACYSYALGEPTAKVNELLAKALEYTFFAFKIGVVVDVYKFINLLSLAVVLGERETADYVANSKRSRYENPNVQVEEIVFTVAELMSAFVRKDKEAVAEILAANNSDAIDTKKIYRYDRMIYFPLLSLLDAIYKKDTGKFTAAIQTREKEFISFFSRLPDKNDTEALIDMPGLAITVFAGKHGIAFTDKSVYRPSELIAGR